jgi:uncharacterized protein (DUF885 family)
MAVAKHVCLWFSRCHGLAKARGATADMRAIAIAIATAIATAVLLVAPAAAAPSADAQLRALYDAEWTWRQAEFARITEDARSEPGDRLPSVTPAAQTRRLAYWTRTLAAVDAIPTAALSPAERINAAVFRTAIAAEAMNLRYRTYEAPFNSDSFFWGDLVPRQPYARADQYRRYLARMADVPRFFDENIANMRAGLARGYSVPRVAIEGRDRTIAAFAVAGPGHPFLEPFAQLPDTIPVAEQAVLRTQAADLVRDRVAPAYQRLLEFMQGEYMPAARPSIDAHALPDGKAFYQDQIREYTTLDLTPDQIHAIGLAEVDRIDADMQATIKAAGFTGSFAEFLAFLRSDPRFYATTPRELLSFAAYVVVRMDGKLKQVFNTLPRYRFTILPVPDAIAPIYTSGRGGLEACLMNTYDLPSRPLYNLTALTLHECSPGHSLQAALALEAPDRPAFRRETYFSGFGEGWGLYTEWLGTRLGMYETPYDEFGRETFEMWRAVRLVIDTGIHSRGWSRQRAIDYLASHTALARRDVETEVDRYISWPGQALAYKLGEMRIRQLRARAEAELGPRFDQRRFHDTLLGLGSVPLPTMEAEMLAFIAAEKAGAGADGKAR